MRISGKDIFGTQREQREAFKRAIEISKADESRVQLGREANSIRDAAVRMLYGAHVHPKAARRHKRRLARQTDEYVTSWYNDVLSANGGNRGRALEIMSGLNTVYGQDTVARRWSPLRHKLTWGGAAVGFFAGFIPSLLSPEARADIYSEHPFIHAGYEALKFPVAASVVCSIAGNQLAKGLEHLDEYVAYRALLKESRVSPRGIRASPGTQPSAPAAPAMPQQPENPPGPVEKKKRGLSRMVERMKGLYKPSHIPNTVEDAPACLEAGAALAIGAIRGGDSTAAEEMTSEEGKGWKLGGAILASGEAVKELYTRGRENTRRYSSSLMGYLNKKMDYNWGKIGTGLLAGSLMAGAAALSLSLSSAPNNKRHAENAPRIEEKAPAQASLMPAGAAPAISNDTLPAIGSDAPVTKYAQNISTAENTQNEGYAALPATEQRREYSPAIGPTIPDESARYPIGKTEVMLQPCYMEVAQIGEFTRTIEIFPPPAFDKDGNMRTDMTQITFEKKIGGIGLGQKTAYVKRGERAQFRVVNTYSDEHPIESRLPITIKVKVGNIENGAINASYISEKDIFSIPVAMHTPARVAGDTHTPETPMLTQLPEEQAAVQRHQDYFRRLEFEQDADKWATVPPLEILEVGDDYVDVRQRQATRGHYEKVGIKVDGGDFTYGDTGKRIRLNKTGNMIKYQVKCVEGSKINASLVGTLDLSLSQEGRAEKPQGSLQSKYIREDGSLDMPAFLQSGDIAGGYGRMLDGYMTLREKYMGMTRNKTDADFLDACSKITADFTSGMAPWKIARDSEWAFISRTEDVYNAILMAATLGGMDISFDSKIYRKLGDYLSSSGYHLAAA
ncbi:MAG: hypothetical protein HY367_01940 [Candidatus Aenigmarchaeota archaeon]|nr:hypothetical protein [Candidatus Aenigmarchaeota archaeon]